MEDLLLVNRAINLDMEHQFLKHPNLPYSDKKPQ